MIMASIKHNILHDHITLFLIIFLLFNSFTPAIATPEEDPLECSTTATGQCHSRSRAKRLNFIAIATILVTSMVGVSLPLFSKVVPGLSPDKDLFFVIRAFASGVIVATGFMHVMPDSWDSLTSSCLPDNPWKVFPFTPFITMISAYGTMMMDSFSVAYYERKNKAKQQIDENGGQNNVQDMVDNNASTKLLKDRVVAQVLELGIVVHSVVIGLSMGSSDNPCTIKPLIAAICCHQLFEGMGLGGCILQAEYGLKMVFFFSVTTPLGIVLGILFKNVYKENSPTALIVVGVLNAVSAGLLIYMALVNLLSSDFKGPKLQENIKLQFWCYVAALLGTGVMSLMAKWA